MVGGFIKAVVAVALIYGIAFLFWVFLLPVPPDVPPEADAVVVLTGGDSRLEGAVRLFEKGVGKRLLISGVSQQTTRQTLRSLAHGGARFDCCADIDYAAQDTRGNAAEAADWVHMHQFHSVAVVTARYHTPRAMQEFGHAMPDVTLLSYPVDEDSVDLEHWWTPRSFMVLQREFVKYLASVASTTLASLTAMR
ncbi:MAG TPA: YdcF family protein [Rhizomicrobium sp.]|nr:YdcF family protein [Rhizomicrobium sp.]